MEVSQLIKSSKMETLLGVSIDSELNFENHISNICSKVSRKLRALGRIAGYITLEKRLLPINLDAAFTTHE